MTPVKSRNLRCDVLVIGGGNAGLTAALEADHLKAKVILMEKSSQACRGGNSRLSGGTFRIASEGTASFLPLLEGTALPGGELLIEPYPQEEFYDVLMAMSKGLADKRLISTLVERSLDTVRWMKAQGVRWELWPVHMVKRGNSLLWPRGRLALVASNGGEGLVKSLYSAIESRGVMVLYETIAQSLQLTPAGNVSGATAQDAQGLLEIEAAHVILASGGFQGNPEWRSRYLGERWRKAELRGTNYDTGEGIQMALAIGAQGVGDWGGCHASVIGQESSQEGSSGGKERYSYHHGIMVNRNGERFIDEGEDIVAYTYAKTGREILKQPGSMAFQVFDGKVIPLLRAEYRQAQGVDSDTIEGLAEKIGVDKERFLHGLRAYNAAVVDEKPFVAHRNDGRRTTGLHPDKTNWAQRVDTPPYRAYAVVCGITMTYGGLKIDEKARVLDTLDRAIPGLYAAGDITGGFFYHNYPSGTGLVRGAVFGRIAGAEAGAHIGRGDVR